MPAKRDLFHRCKIAHHKALRPDAAQKGGLRIAHLRGYTAHFLLIRQRAFKKRNAGRVAAKRHIRKRINGV